MTDSNPAHPGGQDLGGEEVMSTIYACAHDMLPDLIPQPTTLIECLGVSVDSHQDSVEAHPKPSELEPDADFTLCTLPSHVLRPDGLFPLPTTVDLTLLGYHGFPCVSYLQSLCMIISPL